MMKLFKKYMVIALCAVLVTCTIVSPLSVKASSGSGGRNLTDIALTKTGVVANMSILDSVEKELQSVMRDAVIAYGTWLHENGDKEISADTFEEFAYSARENVTAEKVRRLLVTGALDADAVCEWLRKYQDNIEEYIDTVKFITGTNDILGKNVTLSDGLVDFIRELFEEYADNEADYIWINTLRPEQINVKWFSNKVHYDNLVSIAKEAEHPIYLMIYQNDSSKWFSADSTNTFVASSYRLWYLNNPFGIVRAYEEIETTNYSINVKAYGYDWQVLKAKGKAGQSLYSLNELDTLKLSDIEKWNEIDLSSVKSNFNRSVQGNAYSWLITNDGRKVKIFKDLDAFKRHTIGQEPYYITTTTDSYNTTDNSVTVSGDYITGSNYQYSHDVVQNEIDNSETVDNSVINNIVNNNTQTIINNYASSVIPDTGNDNDNGGNGGNGLGSILDGLGSIISAIAEIIGFLLGVIGDVIGLIGSLFTTVFEGIKAIGTILGDFPKLLGDLFVFIPQELIDFLVLSIEASIGIAIWRKFANK